MKARDAARSLKPDSPALAMRREVAPRGLAVTGPSALASAAAPYFAEVEVEEFHVVLLDVRNRVTATEMVAKGSLGEVAVHVREVFVLAVRARAAGVIALHNHPSGDPEPSDADVQLTERLVVAGLLLGVPLVDHIVLGEAGRFVSLHERGVVSARKAGGDQ